jgi:hypothetical protein
MRILVFQFKTDGKRTHQQPTSTATLKLAQTAPTAALPSSPLYLQERYRAPPEAEQEDT